MEPWGIFHKNSEVVVYDAQFKLCYISPGVMKDRGIKKSMIGWEFDHIYGEGNELLMNLKGVKNGSIENSKYEFTDIRGKKHEVLSNFHAFYYNRRKYIIESIIDGFLGESLDLKRIFSEDKKVGRDMYDFEDIITSHEKMMKLKERAYNAGKSPSNVLIYGETGTGKELFVQAIHRNSIRKDKPFVAQNCAAIPKGLFESILFGTERGSYTGSETKKGLFEMAHGGTLYLDELNSMPLELQGKILRTIQEGKLRRVGGVKEINVDVRIIASVNETFEDILKENKLRGDLFFRLNVISLEIPPLRNRKKDIPKLINHYLHYYNRVFSKKIEGVSEECMERFIRYSWPGNIRELRNTIEGIFNIRASGVIELEDIAERKAIMEYDMGISLKEKLNLYEKKLVEEALIMKEDNVSKAAEYLRIPRQTLQSKIKKMNKDL